MTAPELHAVVEVTLTEHPKLWFELPPRPWPSHVRLGGTTSSDHVALLIAVACTYGHGTKEALDSPEALATRFPTLLPGGVSVEAAGQTAMPGCCCGLESWPAWRRVFSDGTRPWTGHDPSPRVEVAGEEIHIWSDGGMTGTPQNEAPITFRRADFAQALDRMVRELEDFLVPLRSWLDRQAPAESERIVGRFRAEFVDQGR